MASLKTLQGTNLDVDLDSISELKRAQVDGLGDTSAGDHGEVYQFVQFVDIDVSAGDSVEISALSYDADGSINTFQVTADSSAALGDSGIGIAVASVTAGNYGWIQISGPIAGMNTANTTLTAGDYFRVDGTNDGEIASVAAGEELQALGIITEFNTTTAAGILRRF